MLGILVIILLTLFFILSYYKSLNTFVKVVFIAALTIQFILARLSFGYTYLSFVILFALILLLLILNADKVIKNEYFIMKYSIIFFGCQLLFLVFLAITSLFRGSFIEMLDFTKFYFFGSFLFLVIISSRKELDINKVNHFIVWVTIFLSFLGLFQYLVPASFNFFVIDLSQQGYSLGEIDLFKRVVGLSLSVTQYSNLLALLLTYTIALIIRKSELNIHKFFLFFAVIIGIISIVLSGIRTPLVTIFIGIILLAILYKNKKLILIISLSSIGLIFFWNIITSIGESYQRVEGFSNPLGRTFQLFTFLESGSVGSKSTFQLTVKAYQDFIKNPIIGSGDKMQWLQSISSITDAYLFYHLIQFGIIGVLIIFFPYLYVIRRNKMLIVLFIVLLLQTLNDTGLFYTPSNLTLWIFFAINIKESAYE